MTDNPHSKIDPETLELHARPRPITRISRKVLFIGAALILALLFGAVLFALDPPNWSNGNRTELIDIHRNQGPAGIETLPSTYDGIRKLGPPNPGDLGASITQMERDLKIVPVERRPLPSYKPDPEEDFRRAERIRLARLAAKAKEAGVFFVLQNKQVLLGNTRGDGGDKPTSARAGTPFDPFAALAAFPGGSAQPAGSGSTDPNSKTAFLENLPDGSIYNQHAMKTPASPYQLMAGTVIAASLITGLNSDLPGTIIAQVTEQVFDTVTGQHLLIPQGTRLIGRYDSSIAFGQNRALIVWQRIIRPDGSSIVIDNLPGTDMAGYAGVADEVDFHTWELLQGIGLSTLLGVGTELSFGTSESDLVRAIRESTQQNTHNAGQNIVERMLDIEPTITVRPGWPIRIIVHKDIILAPMEKEGQ